MEVRQISNRKNKICLCVGIGKCIISVIEMLLIKFYFKSKWPGQNVDLFFLWLGIIGILMILIAGVNTACVPPYILYECGKERNICRNIEIFNGTYRYKCYLKCVYTP